MDKFTVDLDQVLNDFEYSELTTEQNSPAPLPRVPHKSYSSTKHSINNVFSSLNDYLSTEINENIVEYNTSSAISTIQAVPAIPSSHTSKSLMEDNEVNPSEKLTDLEQIVPEKSTEAYPRQVEATPVREKPLESLIAEPILLKIEDTTYVHQNVALCKEYIKELEFLLKEDVVCEVNQQYSQDSVENAVFIEENQAMQEVSEEMNHLVSCVVQKGVEAETILELCVDNVEINVKADNNDKTLEIITNTTETNEWQQGIQEENCNQRQQSEAEVLDANGESKQLPNVPDLKVESNGTTELTDTHCDKVGFHIEVADEEAARYLADLENGDDDDSFHDVPSPSENPVMTLETPETSTAGATAIILNQNDINQLELTQLTITENEENRDAKQTIDINESHRPNSLDIKDAQEVVNIIGNPGSTPYNNMYVNKEVPHENQVQEQLEPLEEASLASSTSVSPTFSEASTDSVHSNEESLMKKQVNAGDENKEAEDKNSMEDIEMQQEGEDEPHSSDGLNSQQLNEHPERTESEGLNIINDAASSNWLGKRAPLWIPDADALNCQHCELKFTMIKRRHHCRACGLVLCSKCCGLKHKLEYLNAEVRVCNRCHDALSREADSGSGGGDSQHSTPPHAHEGDNQPNPNNPMEYCSQVPPHQQVRATGDTPSVMVPVGVLKRQGSNKKHNKSVMFCDGIRPGSDLTNLDQDFNYNEGGATNVGGTGGRKTSQSSTGHPRKQHESGRSNKNKNLPMVDPVTQSFIPENENCLPPTVTTYKSDITYTECGNNGSVVEMLANETLTFAVQRNLHIHVRLVLMDCCVNKRAWCFSTEGLISVGQDEIVILLEHMEGESAVPKDVFHHLNNIYNSAVKGTTVTELGLSIHPTSTFLDSRNHAGFIFIRPTFQCLQHVIVPKEPYLVGVLVHRWETPWARIFPLRLVLRLGAEYRYYPTPLISTRHRDSVFVEIGHTIINLLADFRNFSYTLPNIRGLTIHMEEKSTTVSIPVNRYDQVMKSMSNSSEHILAFGGNFSVDADSHLVCIQDTQGSDESNYKTHAINIQNKPRKVTGASFIVFNGALKSSSGLTAKSSIVEDGLMIQIPPEHMVKVRDSLRNMKNHSIQCGCVNAASDETVNIVWSESDVNFNIGVKSSVDGQSLSGIPSIRVHNGKDYTCNSGARLVRWTEVFLLQNGEENARTQDPVDISKVAESISKATCEALVKYLDLLATNSFMKIGIRTTLHVDDVSYAAGSNGQRLPPIYMKSLDNELVPVLHRITSSGNVGDGTIVLELIFRILNV